MDKELIKKYLEMFKISLIILAVTLLVSIFLLSKIVPQMVAYLGNKKNLASTQAKLSSKQTELETAKKNKERQDAQNTEGIEIKSIYKDIKSTGNSTSDILAGEIQEINDLITYYGIKIYKVDYVYDPADDIFYKEKKDDYGVCSVNMELFASYMKFQSFLKDLYKHEHFLDIKSIEINPYKKDKTILNIKMKIGLYAEKDANAGESREVPPTPSDNNVEESLELDIGA